MSPVTSPTKVPDKAPDTVVATIVLAVSVPGTVKSEPITTSAVVIILGTVKMPRGDNES